MHGNGSGKWHHHGGACGCDQCEIIGCAHECVDGRTSGCMCGRTWRSACQHICGCVYQREYGCACKGIHRHAWGCACRCDWRKKKNDDKEVGKGGRQEVVDMGMRSGLRNSSWAVAASGARCPGPYPVLCKWQGWWRYSKELRK